MVELHNSKEMLPGLAGADLRGHSLEVVGALLSSSHDGAVLLRFDDVVLFGFLEGAHEVGSTVIAVAPEKFEVLEEVLALGLPVQRVRAVVFSRGRGGLCCFWLWLWRWCRLWCWLWRGCRSGWRSSSCRSSSFWLGRWSGCRSWCWCGLWGGGRSRCWSRRGSWCRGWGWSTPPFARPMATPFVFRVHANCAIILRPTLRVPVVLLVALPIVTRATSAAEAIPPVPGAFASAAQRSFGICSAGVDGLAHQGHSCPTSHGDQQTIDLYRCRLAVRTRTQVGTSSPRCAKGLTYLRTQSLTCQNNSDVAGKVA
mmetsp:Transcript_45909/g.99108  ORF Transcript_45909/g.99108 Transcript_45909/m.99108 type:complete len:312 (-) Transcript_45909:4-939(-)